MAKNNKFSFHGLRFRISQFRPLRFGRKCWATIAPEAFGSKSTHIFTRTTPKAENKPEIVTYLWYKSGVPLRGLSSGTSIWQLRATCTFEHTHAHYQAPRSPERLVPFLGVFWSGTTPRCFGMDRKQLTAIWRRTSKSINRTFIVAAWSVGGSNRLPCWIMC